MLAANVKLDEKAARRFHSALTQLGRISGKDFEKVLKHELGFMLNSAVKGTKKTSVKSIRKNVEAQPGAQYAIPYAGPESRRGHKYSPSQIARAQERAAKARARGKNGRALYYLKGSKHIHRHPSWVWSELEANRAKALENKKQARGLAARMWVHIGQQLGVPVQAPGYVKKAKHHKAGDMAGAVQTRVRGSGKTFELGFINALTKTNPWANAGKAWRTAMNKRANYLSQSFKLEAQKKIKSVLNRYPGLASLS